jgi:hypothetical protein
MESVAFRYRSRQLTNQDLTFIRAMVDQHYLRGRSYISRVLCAAWAWEQPNGKLKEYACRDLLLRLEEQGFIELPPRKSIKNNLKLKAYDQIPFFVHTVLSGSIKEHGRPNLQLVTSPEERYLWDYLVHHYHYLRRPRMVGAHLRYLAFIDGQVVACLGWASAAFKVKDRDRFIGWDDLTRRKHLYFIANNVRFLILPWIRIKHLASQVLSLSLGRLNKDWQASYGHPLYLAETFVDLSRFKGTCYQAANWKEVGQTKGSAKKGNSYYYHGQSKAVYLYPLHRQFKRLLNDQG